MQTREEPSSEHLDLPHCVLALIFGQLGPEDLRAVPVVCSAWRAAEAELQELLWAGFAPGFPEGVAKQVVVRTLLFEKYRHTLFDVDALALEAPRDRGEAAAGPSSLCDLPARLLWRLSHMHVLSATLDALAPRRFKCLIIGPQGSGKTSVLDALCNRPAGWAVRTRSLHVETITANGAQVQLWEVPVEALKVPGRPFIGRQKGGSSGAAQSILMSAQRDFFPGTDGLIYVCDGMVGAEDLGIFSTVLAAHELSHVPLLVLASKHDLTQRSPAQTVVSLGLLADFSSCTRRTAHRRRWRVQPCSLVGRSTLVANERAELQKGVHWLVQEMRNEGSNATVRSSSASQIYGIGKWLR